MSMKEENQFLWCSFQAHQDKSIVIEYVVLGSQMVIFLTILYAYVKAKRQNQFNQISTVIKIIIIWLICFSIKTALNIIAYYLYIEMSPSNSQNTNKNDIEATDFLGLKIMSSIFLFLDVTTTFFIQFAMIYIPYLWMKNALQLLSDYNFQVQERIKISRISGFLSMVKKYLLFRNIYLLFFLAVSIATISSNSFRELWKYITIVSITQSIVILTIYPMGFRIFSLIKDKVTLDKKQSKSMFFEYVILIGCNVIRIIMNSIFYFSDLVHYKPDQYCYDDHDEEQTMISCLYLTFGLSLMHILPGSMILYVYWPSKKDRTDLKGSLLLSNSETRIS